MIWWLCVYIYTNNSFHGRPSSWAIPNLLMMKPIGYSIFKGWMQITWCPTADCLLAINREYLWISHIYREYDRLYLIGFSTGYLQTGGQVWRCPVFLGFDPDPPSGWSQRQVQGEEILRNRLPMMEATGFFHILSMLKAPWDPLWDCNRWVCLKMLG